MGNGHGCRWLGLAGALVFCLQCSGWSAESNDLQRLSSTAATNLSGFQVKRGFRVEVVTPEGMVASPVAMAFDENARLFVVEMRDYPNGRNQVPHLGRVRLLLDADGDGVFDSSSVYADNLAWPSAIACYEGGVFVAATPEILYLKDLSGNGVADQRKVVFTGFGGESPTNAETLVNNLVWGPDNQIHGGNARIDGVITALSAPGSSPLDLGWNDFAFDPRALTITTETGSAQTGLCFDNRGRKYFSEPNHPFELTLFPAKFAARNPYFPLPAERVDVVDPGTRIFRFSNQTVPVPNPTRGTGALAAAWMNQPRSGHIYRGNLFPSNYAGNVFIAVPEARVIHRSVLTENGLGVVAQRAPDEIGTEFLVGKDPGFHPTQIVTGPDGALYIADFQSGGESGRILRVVPVDFKQPKLPQLGKERTYDLVATLAHGNGWHRDTAARLLCERRDPAAVSLLTNMTSNSRLPLARVEALQVLQGQGTLNEAVLSKALRDPDEWVRATATTLSVNVADRGSSFDPVWARLQALTADPSLRVRQQVAFALGDSARPERTRMLAEIVLRDVINRGSQGAVLSSLNRGAGDLLILLAGNSRFRNDVTGLSFLGQLALMIGIKGQMEEVTQVVDLCKRGQLENPCAIVLLAALGEGLHRIGSSLALVDAQGQLQPFYDQSLQIALDTSVPENLRIAALALRGVSPYAASASGDIFQLLFGTGQSEAVQSAAVTTLGRYENPAVSTNLFLRWAELAPIIRRQVIEAFLSRADRASDVINALESNRIATGDLASTQVDFLRNFRDNAIRQRAIRIFGLPKNTRTGVLEQYKSFTRLTGDPARGRDIFRMRCAACHRLGGEGIRFGPGLTSRRVAGKEAILRAIIEPSREISPAYTTSVIESKRREFLAGIIVDNSAATITLRRPNREDAIWPRLNIQAIYPQSWSLMPEGLEQGLTLQAMADLIEYVMSASQ